MSNMIKHLKLKHKSEHGEFAASSNVSTQQPTLKQTFARREKMTRDNPRAKKITEVLTQFIVLDDKPLSVVDNVGFRRFVTCHRYCFAANTPCSEKACRVHVA